MSTQTYRTLYQLSKQTHRYALFAMLTLTAIMGGTGILLKYSEFAAALSMDGGLILYTHSQMSPFFLFVLILMVGSGLGMYIFPELIKKAAAASLTKTITPTSSNKMITLASSSKTVTAASPMKTAADPSGLTH